jgi:hypothetical protein
VVISPDEPQGKLAAVSRAQGGVTLGREQGEPGADSLLLALSLRRPSPYSLTSVTSRVWRDSQPHSINAKNFPKAAWSFTLGSLRFVALRPGIMGLCTVQSGPHYQYKAVTNRVGVKASHSKFKSTSPVPRLGPSSHHSVASFS